MKKSAKIIAGILAFILMGGILWFANGFIGNPVSKILADKSAERYIKETYPDMDLKISKAKYNFKDGRYFVFVESKTSIDTHFSVDISWNGKIVYDYYENSVLGKFNTWNRVNFEYRDIVGKVFGGDDFPYESDIDFGELQDIRSKEEIGDNQSFGPIYGLTFDDLEIDKMYDIKELAKTAGHLVFYTEDKNVDAKRASEILLDIKDIFDAAEVPFYAIDFCLQEPRTGDDEIDRDRKSFDISEFIYSDIYEEDLIKRLEENKKALQDYYEKQDAKNLKNKKEIKK